MSKQYEDDVKVATDVMSDALTRTRDISWSAAKLTGSVKRTLEAAQTDAGEDALKTFHDNSYKLGATAALLSVIATIKARYAVEAARAAAHGKETVN